VLTGKPAYVADAHVLGAYLLDSLPDESDRIFTEAEHERAIVVIPSIAVAELIYVYEKAELAPKIWEMFEMFDSYPCFAIQPLDEPILKIVPEIELKELHDRIIVATCRHIGAKALLTKDQEIRNSKLVETIYK